MGSKAFVLLGLLLAFVLLTASEVTARGMAETSTSEEITEEAKNTNGVEESKYPGGSFGGNNRGGFGGNNGGGFGGNNGGGFGGNNGGGFGGNNGGGFGGNNGGGFGGNNGGGFGGNNGGGFGGNNGRGGRGNRGGRYGGGYCRYRCCRRNYYGGCYRCCSYLGEAMDKQIEGQTHN